MVDLKVEKAEGFLIFFVSFHVLLGLLLSYVNVHYFNSVYTVEDGMIEWFTVDALLFSAFITIYRLNKFRTQKGLLFFLGLLLFSIVFIFGAGEEISWGYHMFQYDVPQFFRDYNGQGETNLHNLVVSGKKINKIIFGTFLGICIAFYFLVLPILYKKFEKVKSLVNRCAIPLPRGVHIILYLLLFGITSIMPSTKKGEVLEFGGTFIFLIMILFPLNREIFQKDKA